MNERGVQHCCDEMEAHLADSDIPIQYAPRFREYGLKILDGGSAKQLIHFCPWCGSRLPKSLRDEWFERLERLGLDPEDSRVPAMVRFSIEFLPAAEQPDQQPGLRIGTIRAGNFEERFEAPTEFWTPERYESQWAEAVRRLGPQTPRSCLITSITNPASANFLFWWPMYLIGERVHVQNHVLFFSEIKGSFDPSNPYPHIPERTVTNEDGERISEWIIPFSDFAGAGSALVDISRPVLMTENPIRS